MCLSLTNGKPILLIGTSKVQLNSAQLNLQSAQNTLYKSIQQGYADARAALNKYNASVKSVDAMSESFNYVQQKFDVGMINSVDYNEAKEQLAESTFRIASIEIRLCFPLESS